MHVLGRLRCLTELNGVRVTTEEASVAVGLMAASHVSLTSLMDSACTAREPAPSLSLLPVAEQLYHSMVKPDKPVGSAVGWAAQVS